jgi:hypothetical protein
LNQTSIEKATCGADAIRFNSFVYNGSDISRFGSVDDDSLLCIQLHFKRYPLTSTPSPSLRSHFRHRVVILISGHKLDGQWLQQNGRLQRRI